MTVPEMIETRNFMALEEAMKCAFKKAAAEKVEEMKESLVPVPSSED